MSTAVVIGSYVGSAWLAECVASLPSNIPTIVVCEPHYECGTIGWVHRNTTLDEFLFLPDTVVVKRHEWIYETIQAFGVSIAVNADPCVYGSFMGKYRRTILDKIGGVPITRDKFDAVQAETAFTKRYCAAETNPVRVLFPDLRDGAHFEVKNGRENMVLGNEHLTKWKGAWSVNTVESCEVRDKLLSGR